MSEDKEPEPSIAYKVWFEDLKFCGCGSQEGVLRHLRDAMRAIKDRSDFWHSKTSTLGRWSPEDEAACERVRKALGGGEGEDKYGPFYYMTAYLLAAVGLEEHGGSVPGWLTPKGDELLAFLEATPEENWLLDPYELAELQEPT